jgi:hypothetical protein
MKSMDLEYACECGTTIRASSLDDEELRALKDFIEWRHSKHQEVSSAEACNIRVAERRIRTPERYTWRKTG